MLRITFIDAKGEERAVEAEEGVSVMEAAVANSIPGIDADCGGACACATCHVYVEESQLAQLGEKSEMEQDMLDFAENVQSNSRLACQIKPFEGLRVRTPEEQF